jgi:chaperonin GroES
MQPSYGPADYSSAEEAPQPATDEQQAPQGPAPEELDKLLEQANIAEQLDEELLNKIGDEVYDGYRRDVESKRAWDQQVDQWVKLAAQVKDVKTYPWPNASNIKYPLLATAAMQFAARAYPSLVPSDGKIVQFKVVGVDPQGQKAALADKLAKHMNYQLLEDMEDWEEEMDRLLIQLPIVGCMFKKTYFDPIRKRNCSKLVGPKDLVVNYWATSLDTAHRKTEVIPMTKNQITAMQNAKLYLDCDLPEVRSMPELPFKADVHGNVAPSQADATTPYVILEQHTFWDLDEDGYDEPYVITIEESSKKVLRVVARFDSDGIITADDGTLICIEPVEYYTKYGFIPNPDGGFYDIGFGHLLGPLNESANTLVNILVDSGHLSTLQAGFIGKGLRLKMGESRFQPGEWKSVNATGDDIKKQIFPLPVKEPSEVLFKLLGMILDSGRELASVAEIFTGKMPGQNTPATTTQATIEQGMKVFTAIYKRTFRALAKEFRKIFRLNSLYAENFQRAQLILDEPIGPQDYDRKSYDVCPTADPTAVSTTQKLQKAQMLMELLPLGTINVMEATKRILEGQEQPTVEALMQQPQPQVDPKVQAVQAKMQMDKEKHQMDMVGKQMDLKFEEMKMLMDKKHEEEMNAMKMQMEQMKFQQESKRQVQQAQLDQQTGMMDMQSQQQQHAQQSQMQNEQHQMSMKQMKEKAHAQAEARRVSGVAKPSGDAGSNGSSKGQSTGSKGSNSK